MCKQDAAIIGEKFKDSVKLIKCRMQNSTLISEFWTKNF